MLCMLTYSTHINEIINKTFSSKKLKIHATSIISILKDFVRATAGCLNPHDSSYKQFF